MSLRVVLAGGSGFLGTHLREALTGRGHTVTRLVRRPADGVEESTWDPYAGEVDAAVVSAADVVINLAGSPTAGNPHSKKWARELRESRIATTTVLARAVAATATGGGTPPAFLAGNGISYYGDHGDALLTESSDSRGHGLLTEVTRQWESAVDPARLAGSRVCVLRTAPVMDAAAPPLSLLTPLFKLGLGGRLGSGRQHMAMISLRDWVGAVVHLAEHDSVSGPVNLCCVDTPTNAEFTKALASALGRRSFAAVPAPLLRVGAGDLSTELLNSLNVRPQALLDDGYSFADPDVTSVVDSGLARRR